LQTVLTDRDAQAAVRPVVHGRTTTGTCSSSQIVAERASTWRSEVLARVSGPGIPTAPGYSGPCSRSGRFGLRSPRTGYSAGH